MIPRNFFSLCQLNIDKNDIQPGSSHVLQDREYKGLNLGTVNTTNVWLKALTLLTESFKNLTFDQALFSFRAVIVNRLRGKRKTRESEGGTERGFDCIED